MQDLKLKKANTVWTHKASTPMPVRCQASTIISNHNRWLRTMHLTQHHLCRVAKDLTKEFQSMHLLSNTKLGSECHLISTTYLLTILWDPSIRVARKLTQRANPQSTLNQDATNSLKVSTPSISKSEMVFLEWNNKLLIMNNDRRRWSNLR